MNENARVIFNDAMDQMLLKCTAYQMGEETFYTYGFLEVCNQLEVCPICSAQILHDELGMMQVETKAGQMAAVITVHVQSIYKLICTVQSPTTRRFLELYADIHVGTAGVSFPKTGDDLGDFLSGIGEIN